MRVHRDGETEVGGQVAAHFAPGLAGVVAAHHVPVLLHVQHAGPGRVHRQPVHAVAHLGFRVRDAVGSEAAVDRPPRPAGVVGPERAGRRDGGEHPAGLVRVQDDRVQAHPARARLPGRARAVAAQAGQFLPVPAAVGRPEQARVLHPGVDGIRILQRRLQMPDPRELPRVRRAVVPLVRAGVAVVAELVADRRPGPPPVVGPLDQLAEPPAGLGRVQPVRVGGRPRDVVDLPAGEMRAADVPGRAPGVGGEDERALARADQHPYTAHRDSLPAPRSLPGTDGGHPGKSSHRAYNPGVRPGILERDAELAVLAAASARSCWPARWATRRSPRTR